MRKLYLVCYDIASPKRLRRVGRYLKAYRVEGQKSVYECWVTEGERRRIVADLETLTSPIEDRISLFQLDPRQRVRCFGLAEHFTTPGFFIT